MDFTSTKLNKFIQYDDGAKTILLILFLSQLFLNNGIYLFIGTACLAYVFYFLQRPLKPTVFTIIFLYHFIQIAAGIWLSNYVGVDLNERSIKMGAATISAFIGIVVLFTPIIYYHNKLPTISRKTFKKYADQLSLNNTFKAYIIAFFAANALGGLAFALRGLTQIVFSAVNIKWMIFLLLGYQVFAKNKMKKQFYIIASVEFLLGLLSFFSNFKTVIFFTACIALCFIVYVRQRDVIIGIIAMVALVTVGVKWTEIKGEYRAFLNQGTSRQRVEVNEREAFQKLIDLTSGTEEEEDAPKQGDPMIDFLDRVQYTFHLAKTMERVPSVMPHEYGGNIGSIMGYVLMPRFLNPEKPVFQATVKTRKYTGLAYAGRAQGVSFSLGYFADCYIDFGYVGMHIPLLILGFIFGYFYYYFCRYSSPNLLFNYAVACAVFMEFTAFEADGMYLMGRLFATLLTFLLLKVFLFPWLYKQLKASPSPIND